MTASREQIHAGQAVYTKRTLAVYDFVVLGVSNRFIWRCPTQRLQDHYNKHITSNHLDVGVGTGYFLDHCVFPSSRPRIALLDINENSLQFAAQRIARFEPESYCCDVLQPIAETIAKFDSIGVNYLLHCLPGAIVEKGIIFDHLRMLMNPGATLFGSTLLVGGVDRNFLARQLMKAYNQRGIFCNDQDNVESLTTELNRSFERVSIKVVGCAALFSTQLRSR